VALGGRRPPAVVRTIDVGDYDYDDDDAWLARRLSGSSETSQTTGDRAPLDRPRAIGTP
jgi:hypothetical protein